MDRATLEGLGRDELVVEARRFGVKRPEVLTRVELVDEVLRLSTPNPVERKQVRGWLGIARDLIASAVELGLNLPDAAAMIRGDVKFVPFRPDQPPVATLTLAEIYGAQGHWERAVGMLDEVLEREPDHEVARRLRARLAAERDAKRVKQREKGEPVSDAPVSDAPPFAAFGEDEPDHPTLPVKRAPGALEDDEPDHLTVPVAAKFVEDEPDDVTLMPAKPARSASVSYEPYAATLPPSNGAGSAIHESESPPIERDCRRPSYEPDAKTLLPSTPARLEPDDPPTNRPPAGTHAGTTENGSQGASAEAAVVFARTASGSADVYFELGALAAALGAGLVLRVVEHRSRVDGVERVERDVTVSGARGTATILDLEPGSVVRAALGRKWDGQFRAAVVAAEVRCTRTGFDVTWAPRHGVDYIAVASRSGLDAVEP